MNVAKINMAINSDGEYISIKDAQKGGTYFCLYCKDKLVANLGNKKIHYFRHHNKTSESLECFLYSSADADYSILYYEGKYANRYRFVIDKNFNLKIKLPTVPENKLGQMHILNYYFSVIVNNKKIFSSKLIKKNKDNYLSIDIFKRYNVSYEDIKNAKILGYEILNKITLISHDPVLFKKISGEYINIPYIKTNLSEEFFLMSKSELVFDDGIIEKDYKYVNGIHIYHLYVDKVNEQVQTWFDIYTGYSIVPNRKWIDIHYPNSFIYDDEKILVSDQRIRIQVTPFNKKDRLTYLTPDNKRIEVPFNKDGIIEIFLDKGHKYNFSLNHEIANELTVERVGEINNKGYLYSTYINNTLLNLNTSNYLKEKIYSVKSVNDIYVYRDTKEPLVLKALESNDIYMVHIPYIGTYKWIPKENINNPINISEIIYINKWGASTAEEFQKILTYIKQSNISGKSVYINKLLSNYNKLPINLLYELRRGR